jgi:replicative DNA helicase
MINGLNKSHLLILAARPAMGKTALALNIAENICFKSRIPVGIFSLEMTAEQLVHRMICSQSEVESDKIRTGSLNSLEFQRVVESVHDMSQHIMIIDDQPGLKITDLRARARRMKESHQVELIVIDYLQLISGSGSSRTVENRQNEISEISRMLKNLARELDVPIVCISQLSRKVEERTGHRPMMSDLRESGSIEQDADIIMFLLRREYYDPHDRPGQAELIVAKNRHGGVGSVNLTYRKEIAQFANFCPNSYQAQGIPEEETIDAFRPFSPV